MPEAVLQPSDEQLAREAQGGALEAFEELVRRHEGRLFNFLCQKIFNGKLGLG